MSEDDDYRVEARLAGASRGVSPTTEQIQTLLERQRTHEKLTRAEPANPFAKVMRQQGDAGSQDAHDAESKAEPEAPDVPVEEAQAPPAAPAAVVRDTFVRRGGLPPGFQRSGRPVPQAAPQAEAAGQTPPPTGPLPRPGTARDAPVAQAPSKVIIRG